MERRDDVFQQICDLCSKHTYLSADDAATIGAVASRLPLFADAARADIFVTVPSKNPQASLVVAQTRPQTAHPIYLESLVGQPVLYENDPDIIQAQNTGASLFRSYSKPGYASITRNIVPMRNSRGWTIGCLVLERDTSEESRTALKVERLETLTQQLGEALLGLSTGGDVLGSLLSEGLIFADREGSVTYANRAAQAMFSGLGDVLGKHVGDFLPGIGFEVLLKQKTAVVQEFEVGGRVLSIHALPLIGPSGAAGVFILLRNLTELRDKEQAVLRQGSVIREIHHRVKNNLQTVASLLRLQARRVGSAELKKTYAESINRIMTMALVHQILSHEPDAFINIKTAFVQLVKVIAETMLNPKQIVETEVTGDDVYLDSDIATVLCLVVNELVQNSFKHAFVEITEGKIVITLSQKGSRVYIDVWDNGMGFPVTPHGERRGLGLQLVETLVNQLKGDVVIKSVYGAQVLVSFPIPGGKGGNADGGRGQSRGL